MKKSGLDVFFCGELQWIELKLDLNWFSAIIDYILNLVHSMALQMPSSLFIPQDYKSCGADFTPGIVIMLLVLSFMMVGNGLCDALDTCMTDDKPIGNV